MSNIVKNRLKSKSTVGSLYTSHRESENWGQPPASNYDFIIEGNVMRGILVINMPTSASVVLANAPIDSTHYVIEDEVETNPWDEFSNEELTAMYAEAAEEDAQLARFGLTQYIEGLEREDHAE